MSRMTGRVLLIGSVPGETAAEAMRTCAEGVGDYLSCLPDGEIGYRRVFISFLAATVYHGNPALETMNRPKPIDGKENWAPQGFDDFWLFKVKDGVEAVHFDHLGYAAEAQKSYQDFCALRAAGVIPADVRFQVSLPLTETALRLFLTSAHDFALMSHAYEEAMGRELDCLVTAIPPDDLAIQWDIVAEVVIPAVDESVFPWKPPGDSLDRYTKALQVVAEHVPDEALIGCHLCYGDPGFGRFVEPADLSLAVCMANAAHNAVGRQIDFYHMPVPRDRDDDAYFTPLRDLDVGDATLYLGLIHDTDGVEGSLRRLGAARKHIAEFGIATECGLGRRPKETMPELLRIHREVAETIR